MDELDKDVRDELRSLPLDLAELVGRHLVAAERALVEDDPDRAHEHTKVARRFAARIGVVREAAGIVAYRAGNYSEALSDLRAARRMTGSDAYLPIMADCERGMGRPERALDLVRSREAERLDRAGHIELAIVESGARRDLGQHDAAVITLQRLPELRDPNPRPWSARLAFAYADALADAGHQEAATDWFGRAVAFDEDGETDAAERYAELTGAVIEDIEEDFEDLDEQADEQTARAGAAVVDEGDLEDEFDDADDELEEARGEAVLDDDEDLAEEAAEAGQPSYVLDDAEGDPEVASSAVVLDFEDDLDDEDDDEDDEEENSSDVAQSDEAESDEAGSDEAASGKDEESADDLDAARDLAADDRLAAADDEGVQGERDSREAPADETEEDIDAELASSSTGTTKPGIGPAFIEPDFGDILDDRQEPDDKK
ncbi:hypothetical protein [Nonomuraea sp. NPDC003804]|uniref:hypothetical protein n=1 Tax=Nonomuraea sp. NPDC003804 TaxID=3154547 RepID=UPI0033BB07DE